MINFCLSNRQYNLSHLLKVLIFVQIPRQARLGRMNSPNAAAHVARHSHYVPGDVGPMCVCASVLKSVNLPRHLLLVRSFRPY